MAQRHDRWYTRIFSDPHVVEDLMKSFVHEDFVKVLDFSTLKKLNTTFVPRSEKSRRADIVYEIQARGHATYIYLFLEFQSTVDHYMVSRMARYTFEFYQEIQALTKTAYLNPPFSILIYNGDRKWNAPENFRSLLYPSGIPDKYLPEFRYFKIAINEIPRRELVRIRNATAAIFYVENSTPEQLGKNRKELISLLSAVLKKQGAPIVQAIVDRLVKTYNIPVKSKSVSTVEDLLEVSTMLETKFKKWEKNVRKEAWQKGQLEGRQEGRQEGQEEKTIKTTLNAHKAGLPIATIAKLLEISTEKVRKILKEHGK